MIIIEDYNAPEKTFEVYEYDLGRYSFELDLGGGSFIVQVYSPEGELLNEWGSKPMSEGHPCGALLMGGGLSWLINKPGTYRIVISSFSSTEHKVKGAFQFTVTISKSLMPR